MCLNDLSRARRDGLYRTHAPLTTSNMAGRDCPCHPFRLWDARTTGSRVQRAAKHPIHAFATYASGSTERSTPQNLSSSSRTCKQSMYALSPSALPGCSASLRPCIRPRSRAHCCWQMPDLRYLPEAQSSERGGSPSTAEAVEAPICPPPKRRKQRPGPSRALSGSTLLPWPKSAQNKANAQQWSRGRVRGLAKAPKGASKL
jgi:hypothetical protein